MKVCIILSGGMDSTVALYQAVQNHGAKNILALSFNYQSKHNDAEYLMAKRSTSLLKVSHERIDLKALSQFLKSDLLKSGGKIPNGHYAEKIMKKTVVPFRNGIMLSIACGIAESWGAKQVIIGNHFGDHAIYPDCRQTFIVAMNRAFYHGTYEKIKLVSPFCKITKAQIASIGHMLGVKWENTYSCYNGGLKHCGTCSTCYERREAFYEAGIDDPTPYESKENFFEIKKRYERKIKKALV